MATALLLTVLTSCNFLRELSLVFFPPTSAGSMPPPTAPAVTTPPGTVPGATTPGTTLSDTVYSRVLPGWKRSLILLMIHFEGLQ